MLYREFVLRNPSVWQNLTAFVKANAQAMLERGTPVRIIVTAEEAKRNIEQNKRLWGHVYKCIAEQAWVNGEQFDADVWHEHFCRLYGVCDEITLPTGEIITRRKSSRDMTVGEFAEYMNRVEAEAANTLGVDFAA